MISKCHEKSPKKHFIFVVGNTGMVQIWDGIVLEDITSDPDITKFSIKSILFNFNKVVWTISVLYFFLEF